ncbi:unnamed protein product [Paramecium sonneborni]|uniref:Uncharacterized protein n=1 Tax=Paramecium sonneborni TaxID=65129 RepID=A0A8S1N0R6_9CILI|nr:unnamed protein product [Paramecium sonneborni]
MKESIWYFLFSLKNIHKTLRRKVIRKQKRNKQNQGITVASFKK